MESMTFYLIRHGEAENNVAGIANSLPEKEIYHLTPNGKSQAEQVAKFLKEKGVDVVYSSPLTRTQETAKIIANASGLPIIIDNRLCEVEFGVFNGRPVKDFFAKYNDPKARVFPDAADGVESFISLRKRLSGFLSDVTRAYVGKKAALVSHGDTLEQLYGILYNESPGVSSTGWYPEKGSCTEVRWSLQTAETKKYG